MTRRSAKALLIMVALSAMSSLSLWGDVVFTDDGAVVIGSFIKAEPGGMRYLAYGREIVLSSQSIRRSESDLKVLDGMPLTVEVSLELDGRIVPGSSYEELVGELREFAGDDVEFEPLQQEPGPDEPDLELFPMLADILRESDPGARTVPMLLPATTDARHLARLGIQTYGFLPMNLSPGVDFSQAIHGADERIPIAALDFGTDAIYKVLERYGR